MFSLILDFRFKTFHVVFSLIGCEQGKAIVQEYDKKVLFPMFFKCHYHLHLLIKSKQGVVDQRVGKGNSLDIFEMITNTSE